MLCKRTLRNMLCKRYEIEIKQRKRSIQTAKIIHSHLPRTIKKRNLDSRAFLGILILHFLTALYTSFFVS